MAIIPQLLLAKIHYLQLVSNIPQMLWPLFHFVLHSVDGITQVLWVMIHPLQLASYVGSLLNRVKTKRVNDQPRHEVNEVIKSVTYGSPRIPVEERRVNDIRVHSSGEINGCNASYVGSLLNRAKTKRVNDQPRYEIKEVLKFVTSATSSGLDLVRDGQMNDLHSLIGLVSKKLVVFVKIESGKTWLVSVGAQDSVLSLKLRVEEKEGIPRGCLICVRMEKFCMRSRG